MPVPPTCNPKCHFGMLRPGLWHFEPSHENPHGCPEKGRELPMTEVTRMRRHIIQLSLCPFFKSRVQSNLVTLARKSSTSRTNVAPVFLESFILTHPFSQVNATLEPSFRYSVIRSSGRSMTSIGLFIFFRRKYSACGKKSSNSDIVLLFLMGADRSEPSLLIQRSTS